MLDFVRRSLSEQTEPIEHIRHDESGWPRTIESQYTIFVKTETEDERNQLVARAAAKILLDIKSGERTARDEEKDARELAIAAYEVGAEAEIAAKVDFPQERGPPRPSVETIRLICKEMRRRGVGPHPELESVVWECERLSLEPESAGDALA